MELQIKIKIGQKKFFEKSLVLPSSIDLSKKDIKKIIGTILKAIKKMSKIYYMEESQLPLLFMKCLKKKRKSHLYLMNF